MNSNREAVIEFLSEVTDSFWDSLGTNQLVYMGKELNNGYATLADESAVVPTTMKIRVDKSGGDKELEQETLKVLNFYVDTIITYESIRQYLTKNSNFKVVFDLFAPLSIMFKSFHFFLTPKEKMNFIAELCRENLEVVLSNNGDVVYGLAKIKELRNSNLYDESLALFVFDRVFPSIMGVQDEELTKEAEKTMKRLIKTPQLYAFCDQGFLISNRIIKEHYLDKIDSYTVEDVEKIMDALEGLGICDELLKEIKKTLLADVHKRLSKQTSIEKREKDICGLSEEFGYEFSKKVHRVDPKERNRIYQEVEEAIDLRDMTFKEDRYVSVGEQIQWVSKLLKLNINRQMIEKLLRDIDFTNQWCMPSIFSFYLNNRGKLVYFKDKYCLGEKIRELDDYFYEMKTASELGDEADCQFWEKELMEGTKDALSWIPKNFEYEFVSGEKLYEENRVGKPVKILGRNNIGISKK